MVQCPTVHCLGRLEVVADAGRDHVADEEPRIGPLLRRQGRQRRRHVRAGRIGENHALGDLARQCHHLAPQRSDDDRRQGAQALLGAELLHEPTDVSQRLAGRDAHPHMRRPMRHADPQPETTAGHLVHHRRALSEIANRALVDWRDCGAERDVCGVPRQRLAQRHVAEHAGRVDAGKTPTLNLLCDLDEGAPAADGDRDEAEGGQGLGHRMVLSSISRRLSRYAPTSRGNPKKSPADPVLHVDLSRIAAASSTLDRMGPQSKRP